MSRIRGAGSRRPPAIVGTLILLAGAGGAAAAAATPHPGLRFRNISGVVQGDPTPVPAALWRYALGWDRQDLVWSRCEPRPGEWNQGYLRRWERMVLAYGKDRVRILPILDYNAPWSWERSERTFQLGGDRWHVQPRAAGKYRVTEFARGARGQWRRVWARTVTPGTDWRMAAGPVMWPLAAGHVKDWQSYVRRTVGLLRRPPYNLEYFQIWNEAYPTSGYWFGGMGSYFRRVFLPAAKVIHQLGGKVVYGGWPCIGPLHEYVGLLDKYHAWKSVDVLDVHYMPLAAWRYLYEAAEKRGYNGKGIWQTEIGFSPDPGFISNFYPRFLYWALTHGGEQRNRYKVFYFAFQSPDDPKAYGYGKTLYCGPNLAPQGLSLRTLGELFHGHAIHAYPNVYSNPPLKLKLNERLSSLEAFEVRGRIVVAIHLIAENYADIFVDKALNTMHLGFGHPSVTLILPKLRLSTVQSVQRWDLEGRRTVLTKWLRRRARGGVQLSIPVRGGEASPIRHWPWLGRRLVRTFYTVFNLAAGPHPPRGRPNH